MIAFVLIGCLYIHNSIAATCQSQPPVGLGSFCSGAVDYSYYLPDGMETSDLNAYALKALTGGNQLSIMPTQCQASIKKLICSSVYLKCQPGIDLTNVLTYNFKIYPGIPMPFQRPCMSVCSQVDDKCYGFLNFFGMSPNCTSTYDYSSGKLPSGKTSKYDSTNNPQYCNKMPSNFSVAATSEPYIYANGGGVCSGIVEKLYVPPGNAVSTSLAPMQPPFVVQTAIEKKVASSINSLPLWVTKECRFAIRKYACGSYMLAPQPQIIRNILLANGLSQQQLAGLQYFNILTPKQMSYEFYMPSYPDQSVCLDYLSACKEFAVLAGLPACDSITSTGAQMFPTTNQTLMSVPMTVPVPMQGPMTLKVNIATRPNAMHGAVDTSGYEPKCPGTFVIPDDPSDEYTKWVPGSACAIACQLPVFDPEEVSSQFSLVKGAATTGFIMISVMLGIWLSDVDKRKQHIILCFSFSSWVGSLMMMIGAFSPFEKTFCRNNANGMGYRDGPTFCNVQGVIIAYSALCCAMGWLVQCYDLCARLVFQVKKTERYWVLHVSCIFGLPLIQLITVVTIGGGAYGFGGTKPWCFMGTNDNVDPDFGTAALHIPVLVMTFLGLVPMAMVLYKILQTIRNTRNMRSHSHGQSANNTSELAKAWKDFEMIRTPAVFVFAFLIVWISLFTYSGVGYTHNTQYTNGLTDWIKCVFKSFTGTDASWQQQCGLAPKERPDPATAMFMIFCGSGQSIFLVLIYLPMIRSHFMKKVKSVSSMGSQWISNRGGDSKYASTKSSGPGERESSAPTAEEVPPAPVPAPAPAPVRASKVVPFDDVEIELATSVSTVPVARRGAFNAIDEEEDTKRDDPNAVMAF